MRVVELKLTSLFSFLIVIEQPLDDGEKFALTLVYHFKCWLINHAETTVEIMTNVPHNINPICGPC
jgi:hypothetical protein